MPKIHPFIRWGTTALFAFFIFYVSSRPFTGVPSIPHIDKVAHFLIYATFSFLLIWSFRTTHVKKKIILLVMGAFIATIYGALMEYYQSFMPGRTPELLDAVSNAAGAFIMALICSRLLFGKRREIVR